MMSGCYIDELEGQRRELEARRTMLEERYKLRLATAQVTAAYYSLDTNFAVLLQRHLWAISRYYSVVEESTKSRSKVQRAQPTRIPVHYSGIHQIAYFGYLG